MVDHNWILDVLDDLTEYALKNKMPNLENNIRATANSAKIEIAAYSDKSEAKKGRAFQMFNSHLN